MFILAPSPERVTDRHSDMPRVARLHVALGWIVRRLESELETALRIVPVEEISYPNFRAPAIPRVARLQMGEDPRRCTLIVRGIEIEVIEAREIDTRVQAAGVAILEAEIELILRCMRLLAAVQIALAERVIDVARFED